MKLTAYLTCCCLLICALLSAQKIEKYYDYAWKECAPVHARYYTLIQKTDSGWLRNDFYIREKKLQEKGLYIDEECKEKNGTFTTVHPNGLISTIGKYVNNKKEGLWIRASDKGLMTDSAFYQNDHRVGTSLSWHENGYISDSSVLKSDGSGVRVSWFDNGQPSAAGRYGTDGKETGVWNYHHKSGGVSAQIIYKNGVALEAKYFDESGNLDPSAKGEEKDAEFPGGQAAWTRYLMKKLYSPIQYRIEGADQVTIVVDFIIDEEGNVTNVRVSAPFHPGYDNIAENIIKKSPRWQPASQYNRNIKAYRRQPVTFGQQ